MKKNRFTALALLLIFLITATGGCSGQSSKPAKTEELKIGVILPLSGPLALLGNEIYDAIDIAAQITNRKGGINGKIIKLDKADSPDPTTGASQANRLVNQNNYKIIIGTYASGIAMAAVPVVQRANATYVEVNAVADAITGQGFRYIWRNVAPASKMGSEAVNFAVEHIAPGLKTGARDLKLAIIYEDSAWGTSVSNSVRTTAKENGLNIVSDISYNSKSTDLSSVILKLKEASPDVVIASSYIGDAILLQKQAKQFGFRPKAWIGTSAGHALRDFGKNLGQDAANGIFVADLPGMVADSALNEEGAKLKEEFMKEWNSRHDNNPTGLDFGAFDGAWTLFNHVLPKCSTFDAEEIRKVYLDLDIPDGSLPDGTGLKFGENGQNQRAQIFIEQWQDGKLVTVWPKPYATGEPKMLPLPPY